MSQSKRKERENLKSKRGSEEGSLYQKVALWLLAEKGYELSKRDNSEFRDFAIGREINIGKDAKLDDVVFSYIDQHERKNFIFLQIKHKQDDDLINSQVLSTAEKNVRGSDGNLCRDFNLQKYFISYLSVRAELKTTQSEELKGGKIKYVALFTNISLNSKELNEKGFNLKEAPTDIVNLFTLKKPTSETQRSSHCYQLGNVSADLHKILKKSSDLDRLARELAKYVVRENYRMNRTMGIDETPIKHYHFGLGKYVIRTETQTENKQYCEAQFTDDFLDCDETAPKLHPLRNALFEAIRDESKKYEDDDKLKRVLKAVRWKTVPAFGKSKQNIKPDLPREWIPVKDEDITEFLQHLVFIVEQPRVAELEMVYKSSIQRIVVEDTSLMQFLDTIYDTGPEFRNCVEKVLEMRSKKRKRKQQWIFGQQIKTFIEEKKQLVSRTFVVSAMTFLYKNEVMQYGKFNDFGKIIENVKNFLTSDSEILCVNTPVTLLSSIKISQALNIEKNYPISVSLNILNTTENRDFVLKAFELESTRLLTIECRHAFKDQDFDLFKKLFNIAQTNSNKKIILIMQKENCDICTKHFKTDFQGICVIKKDSIELKNFEPKDDPLAKKVLVFQGQKERVSLSDITGIDSWPSYVHTLSQGTNEEGVIDGMTLVEILSNDEIEVGSKPAGTSSLEGAYAQMYKEINVETLVSKLTSQEHDNTANDMYIISGISGSNEQDKTDKLIQYLGRDYENEEFKDRLEEFKNRLITVGVNNLQVFDDQFRDKNFQEICHRYPEKRIFWICLEWENNATKFMLQEIYNPKFYLKRKFKNVIIKKDLKELLIKDDLSEIFVFCCVEDKQQLYKSMELNECEIRQFGNSHRIRIFFQKSDAEATFRKLSKQNETVHLLEFEKQQFVWCESHGSVKSLKQYIDHKQSDIFLIEEDKSIEKIKNRKVVIFADDPGMGKTTTLIKLYETEIDSSSIIKSHWIIGIKLRDHLEDVRDLQSKKDVIDIINVVEFLSKIDLKLSNNLAKNLLKIALDKSESFHAKPLLLVFDGFDEVLDEDDRNRILLLIKFIKNKTAAKLWITTRCHFKTILEEALSTIAIQFSPMDDTQKEQYITTYLKRRLYLILNKEKYAELFDTNNESQNNEKIPMYASAFINKMQSIFKGDTATFIGTPLQLYLMLEDTVGDFKNWIRRGGGQIPDLKYVHNDVCEVYEHFVKRKYDVYFQKRGIREHVQQKYEKLKLDQYHKDLAVSKIREINANNDFEPFKDIFLLVGVIKSQGNNLEFIHKTFEEFFASKAFIDWIIKAPETDKEEYLLKVILLKADYQLVRTFMNLQLQKLSEQSRKDERPNELDKSQETLQLQKMTEQARHYERLKHYGNIAAKMHIEQLLIGECRKTPLHVAVDEGNKAIAHFLLNSLREQPDVLTDFLFNYVEFGDWFTDIQETTLHLACAGDDVEIVKILLDAAAGISEDTLQEFLRYLDDAGDNALTAAARYTYNVQIFNELLSRANNKLDLILNPESALIAACSSENEKFVEFLLWEFKNEDCLENGSLKKILLHNTKYGNALCYARSATIVEKLICAAKSMKDNNETLKNLLIPEKGPLPLYQVVFRGIFDVVEKLLNVAKEIDDDTLKQLLLNERHRRTPLHVAAVYDYVDIINLLLETASNLDIEILEKLITAVDEKGRNAIELMFERDSHSIFDYFFRSLENRYEKLFVDFFKMLQEYKYENIRKKVKEMLDNVPLENRLYWDKKKLIMAIESGDIQKVKDILSKAKNSSLNPNERLRILLLFKNKCGNSTLYIACKEGNTEIMKELLSYAKEIDDDNRTLKQLLLHKRNGKSALHAAAEKGHFNITKLLLETASGLRIDILEELIFRVNEKGKNAILLIAEHGHESIFAESFKMLKDEHPIIWGKVKEMYDKIAFERTLYSNKETLIMAIERGDIETVKDILNKVKNSSVNPNESLRFLLLSKNECGNNTLYIACKEGNAEIMKELLSYAKEIDDDNHTLKRLLLHKRNGKSALHVAAEHGIVHIINLLLETASNIDIEILEKLITAVDVKGENAIELMFQYGHGDIFVDSFKMFQEDKYENIRKKVKEMFDNVPLEKRLYWDKKKFVMAIESGDIQKVKDILSNAKNSSFNPNERLRILLLSKKECVSNTLCIACKEGNTEIMKELLSYAKEIDDDNRTLKQLLLLKRNGKYALHVAAKKGLVNVTKLLLETASGLGIDILEEIIFHVNKKGKNAIQLIAEHGPETIFAESFKILKDEYPIIWAKVKKMYDNIPFERTLYSNKKNLIMAIEWDDIEKVKDILNKVKNSSVNPNESLRFVLLSENKWGNTTLHTACGKGNTEIMKELLSFAMNMDDGGATLKELLTELTSMFPFTPLKQLKYGYSSEIKQILDSLIVEARNHNRDHVVNILEQINNQYSEKISSSGESDDVSEETIYEDSSIEHSEDSSSSSSEDSDSSI